jgi:hypothetical protein
MSGSQVLRLVTATFFADGSLDQSSLLKFYWVSISGIDLLGVMYRRFPSTHEIIHGEFGTIKFLNTKYALTLLSCQSHWDKCFKIHVFFVCHFVL